MTLEDRVQVQRLHVFRRAEELRAAHGLRLEEVAAASGCGERTLRRLEAGELAGAKALTLMRVAFAVGVSVAELVPALAVEPPRPGLIQRKAARSEAAVAELERRRRRVASGQPAESQGLEG